MKRILAAICFFAFSFGATSAQEIAWVQIEARPTQEQAQERAIDYSDRLDDVSGFALASGWYGIVLGPYGRADAELRLRQLNQSGRIPADSFISDGRNFGQQFWPTEFPATINENLNDEAAVDDPAAVAVATPDVSATETHIPDETPREARASESLLNRTEREELQIALRWAGFYDSAIDGAFGRGTRRSMEAWQVANAHEPTGILTSRQRAQLISQYNAVLEGMNMALVRDDEAGISVNLPTGVVAFDAYEPPFAKYEPTGDIPARVLLISQNGDRDRLYGLYEILQTLEIMPLEGPRNRGRNGFTLEGRNDVIHSFAEVSLSGNEIKGFVLVWPSGDNERRSRVLDEMRSSFSRLAGTLDPAIAPADDTQSIDLVSGLRIRQPQRSMSGFYLNTRGSVLTSVEAVAQCDGLTLDDSHDAEVAFMDEALGIAVLNPLDPIAPLGIAEFQKITPRLMSSVAVGGFPYGGVLSVPTLTFGNLADIRGLNGEEELQRLSLVAQPGDAGGPVLDEGGAVTGMLLPKASRNGQVLPAEVNFALDASVIIDRLNAAGIETASTETLASISPELLTQKATDFTVLVSCW